MVGPGGRKMTLGETIRLSIDDLPGPARACFDALGSFAPRPQRFTTPAALEIAGATRAGAARVAQSRRRRQANGSLSLHPTVADVARTTEAPGAAAKHCRCRLSAIKDDRRDPARADEAYGQLRWAWQRAAPEDEALLVILASRRPYQARRGLYAEALAWATRALPVAEARKHTAVAARVLGMIGDAEKDLGLYKRAWADPPAQPVDVDRRRRSLDRRAQLADRCARQNRECCSARMGRYRRSAGRSGGGPRPCGGHQSTG